MKRPFFRSLFALLASCAAGACGSTVTTTGATGAGGGTGGSGGGSAGGDSSLPACKDYCAATACGEGTCICDEASGCAVPQNELLTCIAETTDSCTLGSPCGSQFIAFQDCVGGNKGDATECEGGPSSCRCVRTFSADTTVLDIECANGICQCTAGDQSLGTCGDESCFAGIHCCMYLASAAGLTL